MTTNLKRISSLSHLLLANVGGGRHDCDLSVSSEFWVDGVERMWRQLRRSNTKTAVNKSTWLAGICKKDPKIS